MKRRRFLAASACGIATMAIPGVVTGTTKPKKVVDKYSAEAIENINFLLRELEHRIRRDYVPDMFTVDQKVELLERALCMINATPWFTRYTFEDTEFVKLWAIRIADGAKVMSAAMIELMERGMFVHDPVTLSDILMTSFSEEFQWWWDGNRHLKTHGWLPL